MPVVLRMATFPHGTRACGRASFRFFDWESSEWEAPLGWDSFHFSVQVAGRRKKRWRAKFDLAAAPGARGLFLLYLLSSLAKTLDEQADFEGIEYRRGVLADELATI